MKRSTRQNEYQSKKEYEQTNEYKKVFAINF